MTTRTDATGLGWRSGALGDRIRRGTAPMSNTKIYWLHTLSPTHVGTGRGVGYIDLPIHRDKVTNWPVIPGSAFKGVWRDWAQQNKVGIDLAFGRASDNEPNASNSGSLIPTDARL